MSKKKSGESILVIERKDISRRQLRGIIRRWSKYLNRWRLHMPKKCDWHIIQCDIKRFQSRIIDKNGVGEWEKHPVQSAEEIAAEWAAFNASRT